MRINTQLKLKKRLVNVQQKMFAINAWTSRFNMLRPQFQRIIEYTQGVSQGLTVSHLPWGMSAKWKFGKEKNLQANS